MSAPGALGVKGVDGAALERLDRVHSGSGRLARPYPVKDLHLLSFASFPGALGFGSNPVFEVMSAARPLFHRKRKSIRDLATSQPCQQWSFDHVIG